MLEIRAWPEQLGLGEHSEAFEAEKIEVGDLADLRVDDLKALGLPMGPRKRLLRAVAGNPALTGFQAPKAPWLRNHEPEAYAHVRSLLLPKNFVRFRLAGGFAAARALRRP